MDCSSRVRGHVSVLELQTQLTSRLQEADLRRSPPASPRHAQPSPRRQEPCGDRVVGATLQELRRLGVNVEDATACDRKLQQAVER